MTRAFIERNENDLAWITKAVLRVQWADMPRIDLGSLHDNPKI